MKPNLLTGMSGGNLFGMNYLGMFSYVGSRRRYLFQSYPWPRHALVLTPTGAATPKLWQYKFAMVRAKEKNKKPQYSIMLIQ